MDRSAVSSGRSCLSRWAITSFHAAWAFSRMGSKVSAMDFRTLRIATSRAPACSYSAADLTAVACAWVISDEVSRWISWVSTAGVSTFSSWFGGGSVRVFNWDHVPLLQVGVPGNPPAAFHCAEAGGDRMRRAEAELDADLVDGWRVAEPATVIFDPAPSFSLFFGHGFRGHCWNILQ